MIALLLYSYFEIKTRLPRLPPGIATALWILLSVHILGSAIFLSIPYLGRSFPQCLHFGRRKLSDYTPKQRDRIMPLLRNMAGLMGLLFGLFFAVNIRLLTADGAPSAHPRPLVWLPIGLVVGETAIALHYLRAFDKAAGKD